MLEPYKRVLGHTITTSTQKIPTIMGESSGGALPTDAVTRVGERWDVLLWRSQNHSSRHSISRKCSMDNFLSKGLTKASPIFFLLFCYQILNGLTKDQAMCHWGYHVEFYKNNKRGVYSFGRECNLSVRWERGRTNEMEWFEM